MKALEELEKILHGLERGTVPIELKGTILELLESGWNELEGSDYEAMEPWKVKRAEDLRWISPELFFLLERHGATVMGSTRAEMQVWIVNLEKRRAAVEQGVYRQLYPKDKAWHAKSVAEEITNIILSGSPDPRIQRTKSGRIKLISSEIFPSSVYRQTQQDRIRRFYRELMRILESYGYKRVHGNLLIPPPPKE
ncbi:MAG: hypothetical protein A2157_03795 [Deltaproteobacteria bacterium RBG_16_47_11]|nr:MAG: hypothetical protein A2157_03795 [Deltaproteobacteria bacterium RBG_16_47_11]